MVGHDAAAILLHPLGNVSQATVLANCRGLLGGSSDGSFINDGSPLARRVFVAGVKSSCAYCISRSLCTDVGREMMVNDGEGDEEFETEAGLRLLVLSGRKTDALVALPSPELQLTACISPARRTSSPRLARDDDDVRL